MKRTHEEVAMDKQKKNVMDSAEDGEPAVKQGKVSGESPFETRCY